MPSIFGDHMVLQHSANVAVFGEAKPGEPVTIRPSWAKPVSTRAQANGRWMVRIRTSKPGPAHTLTVESGNSLQFKDVLFGEVWLCSGQSNMQWSFQAGQNVQGRLEALASGNQPNIRLYNVPLKMSRTPDHDIAAKWQLCTPQSLENFSAVGYFFGRHLQRNLNVPVGMVNSSYGGTEVELWLTQEALFKVPSIGSLQERESRQDAARRRYARVLDEADPLSRESARTGSTGKGWAPTSPGQWARDMANWDGIVTYMARFELTPQQAKSGGTLSLGPIDDADTTWVNGTPVGFETVWNADRDYAVPASALKEGQNIVVVRVLDTGGGGGFGSPEKIKFTVGGKAVPLTDWQWHKTMDLAAFRAKVPQLPPTGTSAHSTCYNAMLAPLVPYTLKGAVWYQGESNVSRAMQYRETFPAMIANWRSLWGQGDFPFYYVQIAPFSGYSGNAGADLRESQLVTMAKVKNTGMVVVTDKVSNLADIHPVQKLEVGERLGNWALAKDYGRSVKFSGPLYKGFQIRGGTIRVDFDHADGLQFRGEPKEWQIAGADKVFHSARATVVGNSVVVWSDAVSKPVAVRFAYSDAPTPNFFNRAGLPASPFRTDTWPTGTAGVSW